MTDLIATLVGPHWLRTYGIALGMALLLTFTAANGTDGIPFLMRFAYWLVLMVLGTLVAQMAGRALDRFASLNLWQTIVAMIANHRQDLVWKTMRANPHLRRGLARAGFRGGWLG